MAEVNRYIEYENGDFAVDLFPYKIKNRDNFIYRDHPVGLNPNSFRFKQYWEDFLKLCLEGKWVNDEGTWVFMMPKLFFYINYVVLSDEERNRINPRLRDNEWIAFTYFLCSEGFSGFEGDDKYTCNKHVGKLQRGELLQKFEQKAIDEDQFVKTENGEYKQYVDPWTYLTETYLITDKRDRPLGQPIYNNGYYNIMMLCARAIGKSYAVFMGYFFHEWLFGGIKRYEDRFKVNNDVLFTLTSPDTKALTRSVSNLQRAYYQMPGQYEFPTKKKDKSVKYYGPFYKNIRGTWQVGASASTVEHVVKKKDNTNAITGSLTQITLMKPTDFKILTGDRFRQAIIEEVGFVKNLKQIFSASKDALRVGKKWVGQLIMLGCVCEGTRIWTDNGELINIEDLTLNNNILGFSKSKDSCVLQKVGHINPPTKSPCVNVTLNSGRSLDCSIDHPIYCIKKSDGKVMEGFLAATYLKRGDKVAVPSRVDLWGDYNLKEARMLGILLGDGSYAKGQQAMLSSNSEEILSYVKNRFSTNVYFKGDNGLEKLKIGKLRSVLEEEGMYGQTKLNKRLPKNIFISSKEDVAEFIGGYYDTDGCVYFNDKTNEGAIKVTSISKEIITELQHLLQKFNIHGCIRVEKPRITKLATGKNPTYSLYIKDSVSVVNFRNNIKLHVHSKQTNLDKFANFKESSNTYRLNKDKEFRWEKVVSVSKIGLKDIYNIKAESEYNYLANGILTHNTGGDMASIQEPKDLFENPEVYNIFPIPNYWVNKGGEHKKTCGLFMGSYYKSEELKDPQGNTIIADALFDVVKERQKNKASMDSISFGNDIMWNPIYPKELLRPSHKSALPITELNEHREYIIQTDLWKKRATVGKFAYSGGEVIFKPDLDRELNPILEWGRDSDLEDKSGAWIMYEDAPDFIPAGLYYVLIDPIQQSGEGTSLQSILVYKRKFTGGDNSMQDTIVASYVGRIVDGGIMGADKNHEEAIKVARYYNATVFPEMNAIAFAMYVGTKNLEKFMEPTPFNVLRAIKGSTLKAHNVSPYKFGIKTNLAMNEWAINRVADWLMTPTHFDSNNIPIRRVYQGIFDIRLLSELINFDFENKGDFDSVSALMLLPYLLADWDDEGVEITEESEEDIYSKYDQNGITYDYVNGRAKFLDY